MYLLEKHGWPFLLNVRGNGNHSMVDGVDEWDRFGTSIL